MKSYFIGYFVERHVLSSIGGTFVQFHGWNLKEFCKAIC